ncbi:hypothetical protein BBP40_010195 [Aspergillus hancockii]|nr:hypothetical protein BBP40_010195 [Aspergillus hancockii]
MPTMQEALITTTDTTVTAHHHKTPIPTPGPNEILIKATSTFRTMCPFEEAATIPLAATTAALALFARLGLPEPWAAS